MKRTVSFSLVVLGIGFVSGQKVNDSIRKENTIEEVELFGERKKTTGRLRSHNKITLKNEGSDPKYFCYIL
ncbi:hypothetical protein [Chryseobacterium proteolyticum]|uniref:hypothetical protein n=1 Tax=Chryseobacterium proteolyticum TaxID=118127 RepID=UPI003983A62F